MTEAERKYYEKLKSNRNDYNFNQLFFIDENDIVQPVEGVWFRLIGDIPMFEGTSQRRIDLEKSNVDDIENHPLNQIRSAGKTGEQILDEVWATTPFGDPNSPFYRERKPKKPEKIILQIKLLKIPKTFSDKIEFQAITNLEIGTRVQVSLCDVDSIFSDKPDSKVDQTLMTGFNTISEKSIFNFTLNESMQKKAFDDVEFGTAECYLKITHSKIEDSFSQVFNVSKSTVIASNEVKKPDCKKEAVTALSLSDNEKAKFIATMYGESQGEMDLKDIPWVYVNLINRSGFEKGMNNSSFYSLEENDKYRTFRVIMYLLGQGDEFKNNDINGKSNIKEFCEASGGFVKNVISPKLKELKKYIEENVFIQKPMSCYKGWYGQGYWKDMNIRVVDKTHYRRIWAMATQYFYLQKEKKVTTILIKEFVAYNYKGENITTFLYHSDEILKYFDKNPKMIPDDYYKIKEMKYYDKK
jgi:hypothetical protein